MRNIKNSPNNNDSVSDSIILPDLTQTLKVFLRIGILSFGGPTAQIALMHTELVEKQKWLSEAQFLNALSFCMFLPGPEAMQLATYAGWYFHGIKGGLIAGLLFILPGSILIFFLASIYAMFGEVSYIQAIFVGIKATVIIIVIEALLRISKKALKKKFHWAIAGLSFVAFFFFSVPFPVIIIVSAIVGFLTTETTSEIVNKVDHQIKIPFEKTLHTILIWLFIWLFPLASLGIFFGTDHVFTQIGFFFSKLAVVTFGGAYSVLAYMAQEVVQHHQWLSAEEMLDSLGLAETTNGPLILVNEFVGYIAAYRFSGLSPILGGFFGALIALWVTFAPCFLWIFAGAPYIESLQKLPRVKGALTGVTAAVVGVILNLTVWFGLHVFFQTVVSLKVGVLTIWSPDITTVEWPTVLMSILATLILGQFNIGIGKTIFIMGTLSLILHLTIFPSL